jgi:hypothetical protein
MTIERQYNSGKPRKRLRRNRSSEIFINEVALIVNYPDEDVKREMRHRDYWAFTYLLCNPRWQATGSCTNRFSSLFTSSGRLIAVINEFQDKTCRVRNRNCFRDSRDVNKNEMKN